MSPSESGKIPRCGSMNDLYCRTFQIKFSKNDSPVFKLVGLDRPPIDIQSSQTNESNAWIVRRCVLRRTPSAKQQVEQPIQEPSSTMSPGCCNVAPSHA